MENLHKLIDQIRYMVGVDFRIIHHNGLNPNRDERSFEIKLETIARYFQAEANDLDTAAREVLAQIAASDLELTAGAKL